MKMLLSLLLGVLGLMIYGTGSGIGSDLAVTYWGESSQLTSLDKEFSHQRRREAVAALGSMVGHAALVAALVKFLIHGALCICGADDSEKRLIALEKQVVYDSCSPVVGLAVAYYHEVLLPYALRCQRADDDEFYELRAAGKRPLPGQERRLPLIVIMPRLPHSPFFYVFCRHPAISLPRSDSPTF